MQNRTKNYLLKNFLILLMGMLFACQHNNLEDSNISIDNQAWNYHQTAFSAIQVKDADKRYNIFFKLRHTADYRYSNLYIIFKLKGNGLNIKTRYQFKLAQIDGLWLGKGSGNLYTYEFFLQKDFKFPKAGKYTLEIEQNMRDNPLMNVSDIGIRVALAL